MLEMAGISKSYPGVRALVDVDLALHAGEVLALLGENGAGKSTLIKILAGATMPDAGVIRIAGVPANIRSPLDGRNAGIAVIYQEFNLIPTLSVIDNLFLGRERSRFGCLMRSDEASQARTLFARLGVAIDPHSLCRDLSVAQQQIVEIARALAQNARILVMDEPTAALTSQEVDRLFSMIRDLKTDGIGVIFISHRLDEIETIADRVIVLRDGAKVADVPRSALNREQLIERMVGRALDQEFPPRTSSIGEFCLTAVDLSGGTKVRGVSLSLRRGEVLALTGLVGSGRTETARLLAGADRLDAGTITLNGRLLRMRNPRDAIRAGICLLTEDRKSQGLLLNESVRRNFGLPNLPHLSHLGILKQSQERSALARHRDSLQIKAGDTEEPVRNLSGGNQQKVVLAKWLERDCQVMIFDEPTRGIDVGAKFEIYQIINQLVADGKAVLMISSELPEVLGMADRIIVLRGGRVSGEIVDVKHATQADILRLAMPI